MAADTSLDSGRRGGMGPISQTVRRILKSRTAATAIAILAGFVLLALLAPLIAPDPMAINPVDRLKAPGGAHLFGTDALGRDVFDRTVHGARISLFVGASVALLTTVIGLAVGLVAGAVRLLDNILMRVTDALMAIPGILLAIALMAMFGSNLANVVIAITVAELPGMIRLVRSVVLSEREQLYVDAAIAAGARLPRLLLRHILPNTFAPLLVQATLVFASATITEAILSFLGAGTPAEIPTWGNIIAEGRTVFAIAPWIVLFPGLCLTIVVLSINLLGDQLRDLLDPRLARKFG